MRKHGPEDLARAHMALPGTFVVGPEPVNSWASDTCMWVLAVRVAVRDRVLNGGV